MAKFEQARIDGTADPYIEGQSGIEPLCDEQGAQYVRQLGASGSATDPNVVQGSDGVSAERLATQATLDELASQGRSANEVTLGNIALTASPVQLPSIVLRHGAAVSIQNPDGSGQTVYVGLANTITPALSVDAGKATWQIAEGTAEDFGGENANKWWVCATGSMIAAYRVEGRAS